MGPEGLEMATARWSVREADVGESAQLSATLADAFASDPILRWLSAGRRSDRRLRRLMEAELAYYVFPTGRVLTTGDVRGVSMELPPGGWEMTVPFTGALAFVRALGARLPRARRLQNVFEHNHLREPHYYIRYLGVASRFQGRGLGTALLRATLDRCDGEGVPAYLEASSTRSAALYERLGFVHLGRLQVPDGPSFWPMRRAAGET
jgi:ribosomal protein S18 acetylase RimI-like enzyme